MLLLLAFSALLEMPICSFREIFLYSLICFRIQICAILQVDFVFIG